MHCGERLSGQTRGTRKTRLFSERSTKARGLMSSEKREKRVVRLIREKVNREMEEAATMSGCSFKNNDGNECRCNVDDAMMRCNKQIKTLPTRKTM